MANINNISTGEAVNLLEKHNVGRHPASTSTLLDNPRMSQIHPTLAWNNAVGSIHSNSTNGSYINGVRPAVKTNICTEDSLVNIQQTISLADIKVNFMVSQNEEHVCMQLNVGQQQFSLGERSHHYLILLLARQYVNDKTRGLIRSEMGWIDKDLLATMLQLSENHINMHICRFRKQVHTTLSHYFIPPQMIQRRKCEVRFVCDNVYIEGGTQ